MPRKKDRELEVGASAHYDDPLYYTSTYKRRIDDVQFYVDLARKHRGPVLEYGIGNGRVALPVARHGIEVFGIDQSAPMLADLRARLNDESDEVQRRVSFRRGDMRSVRLGKKFPLVICPFNAALHLYTRDDVERFLANVRAHLTPRGTFVVDLSIPMLEDLTRDPARAYHAPRFRHPTIDGVVKYVEHFDYDRVRQILFVAMNFDPVQKHGKKALNRDDAIAPWTTPLAHRQFFPQEWEALLHYNGFAIDRVDGDFYGGPMTRTSDVMVWHAKLKKTRGVRR
jgi:SAM-dependent methyltransferase